MRVVEGTTCASPAGRLTGVNDRPPTDSENWKEVRANQRKRIVNPALMRMLFCQLVELLGKSVCRYSSCRARTENRLSLNRISTPVPRLTANEVADGSSVLCAGNAEFEPWVNPKS